MTIALQLNEIDTDSSDIPKEITVSLISTFNSIIDEYETKNNIQHKALKYIYRGRLIKGTDTPASLKMTNGSKIEVTSSNSNYTNKANKSVKIYLYLVDPDGNEHKSEIKIDRIIKNWLKTNCSNLDLNFDSLSFYLGNKMIDIDKTPHQLKLSNDDKISARYRANTAEINENDLKCHEVQTTVYSPQVNATPLSNPINTITINIKTPNNKIIQTQVNPNETFRHSLKSLLKKHKFTVNEYGLFFNHTCINGKSTPIELHIKDGDTIKLKKKKDNHKHNDEDSKPDENDSSLFSCTIM